MKFVGDGALEVFLQFFFMQHKQNTNLFTAGIWIMNLWMMNFYLFAIWMPSYGNTVTFNACMSDNDSRIGTANEKILTFSRGTALSGYISFKH